MVTPEKVKNTIPDAISSYRDEILDFTKALVRIPAENSPGTSYLACVQAIANKPHKIGLYDCAVVYALSALRLLAVAD